MKNLATSHVVKNNVQLGLFIFKLLFSSGVDGKR